MFHLLKGRLSESIDVHGVVADPLGPEQSGVIHLSELWFAHLYNWDNVSVTYLGKWVRGTSKISRNIFYKKSPYK